MNVWVKWLNNRQVLIYSVMDSWADRLPTVPQRPQWQRHQLGVIISLLSKAQGSCTEVILLRSLLALTLPRAITDAMPGIPRGCVTLCVRVLWDDRSVNRFARAICPTWRKLASQRVSGRGRKKNYGIHLFLHSLNLLGHVCLPRPPQGTRIHTSSASHILQRLA